MKKKGLMLINLFLVCILSLSACEKKTENATDVIKDYYDAMNDKDYEKAMSYGYGYEKLTNAVKRRRIELDQALDATYTLISIEPYSEWLAKQEKTYPPDEEDITGKCERYFVKVNKDYPSGWGAGPSGEYSHLYTMVYINNEWKIFNAGAPMKFSCTDAMKKIGDQ